MKREDAQVIPSSRKPAYPMVTWLKRQRKVIRVETGYALVGPTRAWLQDGRKSRSTNRMPISYTNRKGATYYLCQGTTKNGRVRYYFAREPRGAMLDRVPEGYQVRESVNGVVSLSRIRPSLISDAEIDGVKAAIGKHPQGEHYRTDIKSKLIMIYERVGPDLDGLAAALGLGELPKSTRRRLEEVERQRAQFAPIMRFRLSDPVHRLFTAERMCFMGGIDDWITVEYDKPIGTLAEKLIPVLGTDEFLELV